MSICAGITSYITAINWIISKDLFRMQCLTAQEMNLNKMKISQSLLIIITIIIIVFVVVSEFALTFIYICYKPHEILLLLSVKTANKYYFRIF